MDSPLPGNNRWIDLRSDTVTQADSGMRAAIAAAVLGEDLEHEDPTVNLFESRVAGLLGKPAALFVPTGIMGNLIALKVHTQPGEEIILEELSHIYECEMGGLAQLCGLLAKPLRGDESGMLRRRDVLAKIRPELPNRSGTRLLCLENTHNFAGGTVLDQKEVVALCDEVRGLGLRLHLDGARLPNAAAASGRSWEELSAPFDSVMVSFSKGLGAPAGAALAGEEDFIRQARRVRKLLGGGIHQPGILAAACLYALDVQLPRLAEDHETARRLAAALSSLPGIRVRPEQQTNIVMVSLGGGLEPASVCRHLRERGVLVNALEDGRLRFVTHNGIRPEDVTTVAEALAEVVSRSPLRAGERR